MRCLAGHLFRLTREKKDGSIIKSPYAVIFRLEKFGYQMVWYLNHIKMICREQIAGRLHMGTDSKEFLETFMSEQQDHAWTKIELDRVGFSSRWDSETQETLTTVGMKLRINGQTVIIRRSEKGYVSAIFFGLVDHFRTDPRFQKIVSSLKIQGQIRTQRVVGSGSRVTTRGEYVGFDERAAHTISISANGAAQINFTQWDTCLSRVTARCLIEAVAFYLNAAEAFLLLRRCIDDACGRNRSDLVDPYALQLSEITKIIGCEDLAK